jgi:hypothetical protein
VAMKSRQGYIKTTTKGSRTSFCMVFVASTLNQLERGHRPRGWNGHSTLHYGGPHNAILDCVA